VALIKLDTIKVSDVEERALNAGHLYKDLLLDLSTSYSYNQQLNRSESVRDVAALFDIEAVKTSIYNIFLTAPGQKILNPEFGIDLRMYLFEPVDRYTTFEIEADIMDKLPDLEPRITLKNVSVTADTDNQQYNIELQIDVPSLDITGLSLKSVLNSSSYSFI
tara:strand:- start:349 stop:837 length:489 start_codon:yes stop_codon:yes gene_type:complete